MSQMGRCENEKKRLYYTPPVCVLLQSGHD